MTMRQKRLLLSTGKVPETKELVSDARCKKTPPDETAVPTTTTAARASSVHRRENIGSLLICT